MGGCFVFLFRWNNIKAVRTSLGDPGGAAVLDNIGGGFIDSLGVLIISTSKKLEPLEGPLRMKTSANQLG